MRTYRTRDGDVLDAICKAELGDESQAAAALEANPRLADLGPVYPAGLVVRLPEAAPRAAPRRVRLWGRG